MPESSISADRRFVTVAHAVPGLVLDYQRSGMLVFYVNVWMTAIGLASPPDAAYDLRELVTAFQILDLQRQGPYWQELQRWQRWDARRVGRGSLVFAETGEPITVDVLAMGDALDRMWLR